MKEIVDARYGTRLRWCSSRTSQCNSSRQLWEIRRESRRIDEKIKRVSFEEHPGDYKVTQHDWVEIWRAFQFGDGDLIDAKGHARCVRRIDGRKDDRRRITVCPMLGANDTNLLRSCIRVQFGKFIYLTLKWIYNLEFMNIENQ